MRLLNIAAAAITIICTSASAATIAGDTIDAYAGGFYGIERIKGFGLDAPFVVKDGRSDTKQYSNAFTLDVDGDGFSVNFYFFSQLADGFRLNLVDLNFDAPSPVALVDLDVTTNLSGVTFKVGPESVQINLGNVKTDNGMYFNAKFLTSPVPEVSTVALLGLGLVAIAGCHLSRKKHR